MHTVIHPLIEARTGEPVELIFHVRDANGAPVDLSEAEAVYKIARRTGEAALLTLTHADGIALDGDLATVRFNTAAIEKNGAAQTGGFFAQLFLTLGENRLVAAEGPLAVHPVIL